MMQAALSVTPAVKLEPTYQLGIQFGRKMNHILEHASLNQIPVAAVSKEPAMKLEPAGQLWI